MLLLSITPFGWAALAVLGISILLAKAFFKRKNPDSKPGCIGIAYVGTILFILFSFVLTFSVFLSQNMYSLITKPVYEAHVISFTSEWKESSSTGNNRHGKVLMHLPKVEFIDNENNTVQIETNISSGEKPKIGESIKVVYYKGDNVAQEYSFRHFALLIAGGFMLFLMALILVATVQYVRGKNIEGIKNFGINLVIRVLIPAAILFMFVLLSYVLYQYFSGDKSDMPIWAVVVCGFFVFVLFLTIPSLLKMLWGSSKISLEIQNRNENNSNEEDEEYDDEDDNNDDEDDGTDNELYYTKPQRTFSKKRNTPID